MSQKIFISPSILSADFSKLGDEIQRAEQAGADWIHVDVMDGHFAPNITMGPFIVETCRRITKLPIDVHLMIENPEKYINNFADAGASILSIHIENQTHVHRTLNSIQELGCKAGIVINPGTHHTLLTEVLPFIDLVLVMSVNPGFSGQKFIPQSLQKIAAIRKILDDVNPEAIIEVDGGINAHTLPQIIKAGARAFVAASAIFKHPQGIEAGFQDLYNVI